MYPRGGPGVLTCHELACRDKNSLYPPQILLSPVKALLPCKTLWLLKMTVFPGLSWNRNSISLLLSISSHLAAA